MSYASVVLDIPARALDEPFTYAVPEGLAADVAVGCTVLVEFAHRVAVGYVVSLCDEPPCDLEPSRILSIGQVLAESAFDECGAELALWMAREYACTLADAVHPFLAPGQKMRVRRASEDAPWELVNERVGEVDDRWIALTKEGADFVPRRSASRQRELVAALAQGPMRLSELRATMSGVSSVVKALQKYDVVEVIRRRQIRGRGDTSLSSAAAPRPTTHTAGQLRALSAIREACEAGAGDVVVVDGVTGSGKTEVYLCAIEQALERGKGALVLVPEISLTAQTVGRFRSRYGDAVAVLHSRLSVGERFDQWDLVRKGEAKVVVGARSALFAPLADPGIIIIDEEHEGSYKQDGPPRYHAREVAARLAKLRGCALVLGSATPSLESLARCRAGRYAGASWVRVEMPERPGEAMLPSVQVVDMASEFRDGGRSIFSGPLADALREVVERREKAVIMLNRRGFANFLMCRECGCVPECPHCSTSLTYHERTHSLACHTCGMSWRFNAWPSPATSCPNCGSRYMAAFGVGTQRVEDELAMLLGVERNPDADKSVAEGTVGMDPAADAPTAAAGQEPSVQIIRMDADTTKGKASHQRLLEQFDAAECAVLVGTQMIAKGLDFPEVTLVGVVNADTTLKLPDFRAAERTYALLEQVSGRAGRGERPGKVIIQTYWATHPAICAAATHDRTVFLEQELEAREELGYPPYRRLANVTVSGKSPQAVRSACDEIAQQIRARVGGAVGWEVLGPADCVKARVKDRVRRHVIVKAPAEAEVGPLLSASVKEAKVPRGVSVGIDVDAHDMM